MNVQTQAESIGNYGCLFFCYLYCSGMYTTKGDALKLASDYIDKKIIAEDCTVTNPDLLLYTLNGKRYNVTKQKITSIKEIKEKTPVKFERNGFGHWVVVENGEIVFNSLDKSMCVAFGKPTEARILNLK